MDKDRIAPVSGVQALWTVGAVGRAAGLLSIVVSLALGTVARAITVGVTDNVIPDTDQSPASTPGWTQGDPGWANSVNYGYLDQNTQQINYTLNGVYIGDGWVLSAAHTGIPYKVRFDAGDPFDPIPNQAYQVANPSWNDPRLVDGLADLRLIRINGNPVPANPNIKTINIPTQPLSQNNQIVMMGTGFARAANQSHFLVNKTVNPWTWQQVGSCTGSNCYHGYYTSGGGKRFGTNRIANSDSVLGESDGNLQTVVDGNGYDTIGYVTVYDQNASVVTDPYEAMAISGDSGGGVYYFDSASSQWKLAGIVTDKYNFSGQFPQFDASNTLSVFGNANVFADLASYRTKIMEIINAHPNYSIVGDVNLDGVVTGDGTGLAASDDVTAFVLGWNQTPATPSIDTWKKGDLNRDGSTNFGDFLLLHNALIASGAGAGAEALGSLIGSGGLPEPSALGLALWAASGLMLRRRR